MEKAKQLWGVKGSLTLLRGNENKVYVLEGTDCIFRFSNCARRSIKQIEAELSWLHFLDQKKCAVVKTIVSLYGQHVHQLSADWCITVFRKIEGRALKEVGDFTEEIFFNWGQSIAQLHAIVQVEAKAGARLKYERAEWDKDDSFVLAQRMIPVLGESHFVVQRFLRLVKTLNEIPKSVNNYGLIHADLHHGNFLINKDNHLILFDFDDSVYGYFLYDLAVPLEALEISFRMGRMNRNLRQFQNVFVQGYASHYTLPGMDRLTLETFIQYRSALLYLWCSAKIHLKLSQNKEVIEQMKTACWDYLASTSSV